MVTKAELRFALLECAEHFRGELEAKIFDFMAPKMGERMQAEVKRLCDLCYAVLENPTVADVEAIRAAVAVQSPRSTILYGGK